MAILCEEVNAQTPAIVSPFIAVRKRGFVPLLDRADSQKSRNYADLTEGTTVYHTHGVNALFVTV